MRIDEYAHLDSPLHRWEPRTKVVTLLIVMFAFSFIQDLRLVPAMVALTAALYRSSRLPFSFLLVRLRYPGFFLLILAVFLPLLGGQTVLLQIGPLVIWEEGVLSLLLIASRFTCIMTVGLVLFGTTPLLTTLEALRRLGLPPLLADMAFLSFRYLFEISDHLARMETAMRLRGFRARHLSLRGIRTMAALAGSILVRSYEQSGRVYNAMRLRGYGHAISRRNGRFSVDSIPEVGDRLTDPTLAVSGLWFSYPDQPDVLRGIEFSVMPGERVGLIGPNGAGKTSVFLAVCGILKPDAGEIMLCGEPVTAGKFRPEVGLVFQNPDDQLFSPSVWDDVAFGPSNMGLAEIETEQRVRTALSTVGALHLADRPPHHLSGGEKRMVSIASALVMRPQLMLYDEPDANLDSRSRRRLIRFLQTSQQAILIASHDLELILEVCDRVILIDEGNIAARGPTVTVMGNQQLMEAHGLEKPHSLVPHPHGLS